MLICGDSSFDALLLPLLDVVNGGAKSDKADEAGLFTEFLRCQ